MLVPVRPGSMGWLPTGLAIALLAAPGCDSASSLDAGEDASVHADAPALPRRSLVVVGETSITLAPLAERTLRFEVRDDGGPVADAAVQFLLEGMPRSSTLRELEGTTDSMGQVGVVLVAGPQPTTFRVRATSEGAPPATVDVSVGSEFGELVVTLETSVTRHVGQYVVRAVADVPCADLPPSAGGDERTLGVELATTTFASLSTAASWTLEARGQTAAGLPVARGCVEGLHVSATASSTATVPVRDLPLDDHGAYALAWTSSAGAVATEVRAATLDAAIGDTGASLLLDGLRVLLARDGRVADVDLLDGARAAALDERLATDLRTASSTVGTSLAPIADEIEAGFASLTLEGTLRQSDVVSLSVLSAHVGRDTLVLPIEASLATLRPVVGYDRLVLEGLTAHAPVGTLWTNALETRARAHSVDGLGGVLRDSASCGVLVTFLSRESLLTSCDARCARDACVEAAGLLSARIVERAAELDLRTSTLRFDGSLVMTDDDDDLRADHLTGEGEAHWDAADGSSTVTLGTSLSALRDDTLE